MLLVTTGSDAHFAEALKLLQESSKESADRRLQAILLMQRGEKENIQKARRILEELVQLIGQQYNRPAVTRSGLGGGRGPCQCSTTTGTAGR